jgi:predicted nucleic acid-binding protein
VTLVPDASVVVAALVDSGDDGAWAEEQLLGGPLVAPHLLPAEVANVLRRMIGRGTVSAAEASLAHRDVRRLRVSMVGYDAVADRAWELRDNLSVYDAWYVAVAESIAAALVTLDERLASAPGIRCEVRLPPANRFGD